MENINEPFFEEALNQVQHESIEEENNREEIRQEDYKE